MVDQEGGETHRRIRQRGQRLRTRTHQEGIVDVLVEGRELFVGTLFIARKTGRHGSTSQRRGVELGRNHTGKVGVDGQ